MNGNELFPEFNVRKSFLVFLVLFFSGLLPDKIYAQREVALAPPQEPVFKKREDKNSANWNSVFRSFTVGGLPAFFDDILSQGTDQLLTRKEDDALTFTVSDGQLRQQNGPKVAVDITPVEKTSVFAEVPTTTMTDQSSVLTTEPPLELSESVSVVQTPVTPISVVPTVPEALLGDEKGQEAEKPRAQSLIRQWIQLFFQRKKQEAELPLDVERKEDLPLVITPTRTEESLNRIGRSVSVVSAEQIKAQGSYTLTEAIRNVPGTSVRTLGSLGDFSTVRIRGTRPWDTMFLIEGMPLRDASDTQGSFVPFIGNLFTDHFSQIEVMRGTGSTLYGSEAMGGVVNLRMKQGKEGRPHVKAKFDGGTFGTIQHGYEVSGATKGLDYYGGFSHNGSEGIRNPDAFGSHSFGVNTGYQFEDRFEARFMLNAVDSKLHLNDGPSLLNDIFIEDTADPNNIRDSRFIHFNHFIRYRLNDYIQQKTKFAFMDTDRRFVNGPDQIDRVFSDSQFDGNIANLEQEIELTFNEHYSIVGGGEYEREEMRQLVNNRWDSFDVYRYGPFIENRLSFFEKKLNLAAGGRLSHHEEYGMHESGELSGSYLVEQTNTRFKGHFGTGFREPALYELFGRTLSSRGVLTIFGNPDLKPEKSISWDAGAEQKLFHESITFAGTFFKNEFSRRIAFVGRGYSMKEGGYSQGAEFELKWQPIKSLQLGSSFTRTFSEADGRSSTGLPRNLFGFNLDWKFWNRFHYHLDFTYNGREQITLFSVPSFTTKFVDQKSYTKVDMKFSFDLNDYLTLWARGDNVFDANIREDGFSNPGAQAFGGVSMEV